MSCMRLVVGTALAALVTACGTTDVNTARKIDGSGTDFGSHLAQNYRDFALFEADQMIDWPDAVHFAKKANDANAGKPVTPENPANWRIKEASDRTELSGAHARLVTALANGAAGKAPAAAARAQVQFDCWVEQQEENWQYDHIAACKTGFQRAMANLDDAMRVAGAAPAPQPPVARAPVNTGPYLVFFDWDSARLELAALDILRTAATNAKSVGPTQVQVIGHADRSGSAAYNLGLSNRRARAVTDQLVASGLPRGAIDFAGRGETDPLVSTADGVREPQNRRVEITFSGPPRTARSMGAPSPGRQGSRALGANR